MSFSLQKANFWKRFSAFMFDIMLTLVISLAVMIGLHAIFKVDAKIDKLNAYRIEYAEQLGLDLDITNEEYDKLPEAEKQAREEKFAELNKLMAEDEKVMDLNTEIVTLISVSINGSLLVGMTIWYFILPLAFKQGRTLGKKIFGLAVIRTNGVKLTNPILFVRSLIGMYAIETMFPLTLVLMSLFGSLDIIVGGVTLLLFYGLEIGVMLATKTHSSIHDLLTDSVVVDMASQQIFETQEERTEFDKAEAAQKAAEAENGGAPIATGIFAPKTQPEPIHTPTLLTQIVRTENTSSPVVAQVAEVAEAKPVSTEQAPAPQTEEKVEEKAEATTEAEAPAPQTTEENSKNSAN